MHFVTTNPADLGVLNTLVHDRFFNLETMSYEASSRTLRLPLERSKGRSLLGVLAGVNPAAPQYDLLVICGVIDYSVDGAGKNMELLGEVMFDKTRNVVTLIADKPLTIRCSVSEFRIEYEAESESNS